MQTIKLLLADFVSTDRALTSRVVLTLMHLGLNFLRSSSFCTWFCLATSLETSSKIAWFFQTCIFRFRRSCKSSLRMNPSVPGSLLPALRMSESLSYLRISFFLFQALTELNLHLFSGLVLGNLSCKVHLQVLALAGFLC